MLKIGAGFVAVILVGPLVGLGMVMLSLGGVVQALSNPLNPEPSEFALEDIPGPLLEAYRAAGLTCPGLPWTVLAGIGKVESDHGRFGGATLLENGDVVPPILGPVLDGSTPGTQAVPLPPGGSPWHGHPTHDRALGPMQFLTETFQSFGVDGNGDGVRTPHNAFDAIHSAARYLCGPEGEVTSLRDAIFRYNRSDVYVAEVLDFAARYGVAPIFAGADPIALINHPNVSMGPAQRADLEAGIIDPQLVAILLSLAQSHEIYISSLQTGHSLCIARSGTYPNCRISRHASGRAADIWMFDGQVVADGNRAARSQLLTWHAMNRETNYLRPWTIGHPFGDLAGDAPGSFNDGDHEDHFHISVLGTVAGA
ncbi:MAG: lytic transglycosylase domain-containing protein [Acidimicrobiia bacterium]|nr:lytic transglycosylase domain-containing protein [Acidimicrobiia bacterium]